MRRLAVAGSPQVSGAGPDPGVKELAPGWGALSYAAPEPGSYRLPILGPAGDGDVVDSAGHLRRLHELFAGRVVLLAFLYSSCRDPNGCPLATAVMHGVHRVMREDPALGGGLRLVSLSFDPDGDTPERLRLYARGATGLESGGDWQFLTTASPQALAPLLAAYDQAVQREPSPEGGAGVVFAHVLRVFLIDPQRRIRNIYSASFLHLDLVLADVRTLIGEEGSPRQEMAGPPARPRSGAGDSKEGYDSAAYATRSRSLAGRGGEPADLLALAQSQPLGLPPPACPGG